MPLFPPNLSPRQRQSYAPCLRWAKHSTPGTDLSKSLGNSLKNIGGLAIGTVLVLQPTLAKAQIQRSFINPSFEQPVFGSTGQQCYVQVNPSVIPGWETTHGSVRAGGGSCSGYTSPGVVPLIEIWTTGFIGVSTATTPTSGGNQFAELNAEQNSQLYQNLCLYNGETISFSFLHRGRGSTTVPDVANFLIGLNTDPSPDIFGKFSTTSNGTVTAQPVAQNGATIPAVSNNNAGNGWVQYSGTVPYTGTTGIRPVGFAAVSTGSGDNTVGNFLDGVQFAGKPVLELAASSGGGSESETNPTTNPPQIRIVGLVPTGGITIPIAVSGTAVLGTDFTTPSGTSTINMTIPAGNYDGSNATSLFTIPFTVISNNIAQGSRTITFTVQSSSSFFTSSTTTCGGSPILASTYTIYDDDIGGTIFNDGDGSKIQNGSEAGTNAGTLNAVLINSSNKVVATTAVAANGTYLFSNTGSGNYTVEITTATATIGTAPPAVTLPAGWVSTGENLSGTPDAIVDGKLSVSVGSGTVTGVNFGIKQPTVTVSGTIFSDADADVTINGSDAGTNAGSANLTVYAIDSTGKVVDKAIVTTNGTYSLTTVPQNSSITLRLSNNATVAIGTTAPTTASIPNGWYFTGENINGTVDGTISTLGNIALTTTTSNVTNQNFGIRQPYTIAPDPAPNTCNPDYTGALTTGIDTTGGQLPVGSNDLNWTVEWLPGPPSGVDTPYSQPRPVGVMPAIVVGNLAVGAWLNEPPNARWISYPFRLGPNNNGYHPDANLNGIPSELVSATPSGTTDAVRLKFTSTVTLPSNANTIAISLPIGVAVDNQFVSLKVNGVENLVPSPTLNAQAPGFFSTTTINLQQGWQPGVNTVEIVIDSGPDYVGFFVKVDAITTQVCGKAQLSLVKRVTAINGNPSGRDINGNVIDFTKVVDDPNTTDDNDPNWSGSYLKGAIDAGVAKVNDALEYTIYFLSNGTNLAKNVLICDRVPTNTTFLLTAFNSGSFAADPDGLPGADRGIVFSLGGSGLALSNVGDGDRGQFFPAGVEPTTVYPNINCGGANTNGAVVVKLGDLPNATTAGSPTNSYGFIRFRANVK